MNGDYEPDIAAIRNEAETWRDVTSVTVHSQRKHKGEAGYVQIDVRGVGDVVWARRFIYPTTAETIASGLNLGRARFARGADKE